MPSIFVVMIALVLSMVFLRSPDDEPADGVLTSTATASTGVAD
jgi:hypothetical protein